MQHGGQLTRKAAESDGGSTRNATSPLHLKLEYVMLPRVPGPQRPRDPLHPSNLGPSFRKTNSFVTRCSVRKPDRAAQQLPATAWCASPSLPAGAASQGQRRGENHSRVGVSSQLPRSRQRVGVEGTAARGDGAGAAAARARHDSRPLHPRKVCRADLRVRKHLFHQNATEPLLTARRHAQMQPIGTAQP